MWLVLCSFASVVSSASPLGSSTEEPVTCCHHLWALNKKHCSDLIYRAVLKVIYTTKSSFYILQKQLKASIAIVTMISGVVSTCVYRPSSYWTVAGWNIYVKFLMLGHTYTLATSYGGQNIYGTLFCSLSLKLICHAFQHVKMLQDHACSKSESYICMYTHTVTNTHKLQLTKIGWEEHMHVHVHLIV